MREVSIPKESPRRSEPTTAADSPELAKPATPAPAGRARFRPPAALNDRLRRQDQLVTRDQAIRAGVTRDQITGQLRTGRWQRLRPEIYLNGRGPASDRQEIRAAWLWAGPGAVLTGRTALFWQRKLVQSPPSIQVNIPAGRRLSAPVTAGKQIAVLRRMITDDDVVLWDRVATIRTPNAVHELLRGPDGTAVLDRFIQQGWVTLSEVLDVHARTFGARGSVQATKILRAAASGGHSDGERKLHRILAGAGLTNWTAHHRVSCGRSYREIDVAFVEVKLAIEVDGFAFHSDADSFADDRTRQNQLVSQGWTVLRFTWRQLSTRPESVAAEISSVLATLRNR